MALKQPSEGTVRPVLDFRELSENYTVLGNDEWGNNKKVEKDKRSNKDGWFEISLQIRVFRNL